MEAADAVVPATGARILISAPLRQDARTLAGLLTRRGIASTLCASATELGAELDRGVGALLLTQEALVKPTRAEIARFAGAQPRWSELPLVLLLDPDQHTSEGVGALHVELPNTVMTVLQRPVRATELITAAASALRARQRQYQVRDQLELQQQLLREVNHRVKNTLATVLAICRQSLRQSATLDEFATVFQGRVLALDRVHEALASSAWQRASLRTIAELTLAPYRDAAAGSNVQLRGPDLPLLPRVGVSLGMCLHELATNAVKYGALSVPGGHVALDWEVVGKGGASVLTLRWQEHGGPPVSTPQRRGFGTRFVEQSIVLEGRGTAAFYFERTGLRCELGLPVPNAVDGAAA